MKRDKTDLNLNYVIQLVLWLSAIVALAIFVHWLFGLLLMFLAVESDEKEK